MIKIKKCGTPHIKGGKLNVNRKGKVYMERTCERWNT